MSYYNMFIKHIKKVEIIYIILLFYLYHTIAVTVKIGDTKIVADKWEKSNSLRKIQIKL